MAEKKLSKKALNKSFRNWAYGNLTCFSQEHMQTFGYLCAMLPLVEELYDTKEEQKEAMNTYTAFFNTEPQVGSIIVGITAGLEEAKANGNEDIDAEAINGIRAGLMGPLAGIGDTISWSTLMYLFIGLFLPLAKQGNPLGGIGPIVLLTVICFGIGYFLTSKCYTFGYSFAENMLKSGLVNMIITGASILGLFMMGGLAATYVTVSTPIKFVTSTYTTTLQSILNSIAPGILPLIVVLCIWGYLAKVKRNYFAATLGVTIISLVLGCIGIIIQKLQSFSIDVSCKAFIYYN